MKKLILGLLLIYSVNVLEASSSQQITSGEIGNTSSGIAIGYNPADFTLTFNGKPFPGSGLANPVLNGLFHSNCSNDSSRSYTVVESENPRIMELLEKEIKFSSSIYADPATRLTPNITVATHLVKGNAIFEQGSVSINLRIEDRQGCLKAQAKVSGPENSFYKLIDEATRSLGHQMCMPEPNVQTCTEPYYTIITSQKTTTKVKVIEKYRGINKDLKSYQEDKDTYYIYVDADKAKIEQYHVDAKSTRKIHRETYTLNYKSCQYEIEKEDKLIKNMGGSDILKSEDAGWGFEDDTKIYISLPSSEEELSFSWGSLRDNGRYRSSKKYKKEIPQIVKSMMGEVNDMATLFRNESKNNKGMNLWKSLYDYPGTPEHVQCGGKVAMESFLIPPLDGLQEPDIEFSINIRPSSKSEIKILKKRKNIK